MYIWNEHFINIFKHTCINLPFACHDGMHGMYITQLYSPPAALACSLLLNIHNYHPLGSLMMIIVMIYHALISWAIMHWYALICIHSTVDVTMTTVVSSSMHIQQASLPYLSLIITIHSSSWQALSFMMLPVSPSIYLSAMLYFSSRSWSVWHDCITCSCTTSLHCSKDSTNTALVVPMYGPSRLGVVRLLFIIDWPGLLKEAVMLVYT